MSGYRDEETSADSSGKADASGHEGSSSPGVVGPADVADEVKAVLRAAFDGPEAPAGSSREARVRSSVELDETGPYDPRDDGLASKANDVRSPKTTARENFATASSAAMPGERPKETRTSMSSAEDPRESPPANVRRRRRFVDIARDYDSRQKSKKTPAPVVVAPSKEPEIKVSGDKKRVVITDDEVAQVRRSAPKQDRKRKKSRRRDSDEVTRLPSRRWWSRTADGRWRLRWYALAGVVVVSVIAVLLLLTSPLLSIRSIAIEGNVYASQSRLDEIAAQLKGDPILTADLHGATRQIEAIPWVRKARVSMHLPSRVVIQIDERSPAAFYRGADGLIRVVDRFGRVLDVIQGDPVDYTRIIGTGPDLPPGDFVQQPFLGAVELLGALPVSLSDRLVSATVSPEGEISLQLTPNLLLIFGQPRDFQVKLVAVVNEIKRQGSKSYTTIDVSTGEPNVR